MIISISNYNGESSIYSGGSFPLLLDTKTFLNNQRILNKRGNSNISNPNQTIIENKNRIKLEIRTPQKFSVKLGMWTEPNGPGFTYGSIGWPN